MFVHKLTVIIPCFNEEKTINTVLENVAQSILKLNIPSQLIIIDDGSNDDSLKKIKCFIENNSELSIKVLQNNKNQGKGVCIRKAIEHALGDVIIIQDADLEYHPKEYKKLLQPVFDGHADVVYTSRFRGDEPRRVMFFYHTLGVWFLTFLSNLFTQLNLTDIHSGYKLFKTDILKSLQLREKKFGFDTEVTAKISNIKHIRIYEVGISYYGRTYREGKKIKWTDGIKAIFWTFKYNIFSK